MNSLTFSYRRVKYDLQFVNNGCPQIDGRTDRRGSGTVALCDEREQMCAMPRAPQRTMRTHAAFPRSPAQDDIPTIATTTGKSVCLISAVLIAIRL